MKYTEDDIKKLCRNGTSKNSIEKSTKIINSIIDEDSHGISEYFSDSIKEYNWVYKRMRSTSFEVYVNAIKYCSLIGMMDNSEAWKITFPERWEKILNNKEYDHKTKLRRLHHYTGLWNKSKTVTEINTSMMVPDYLMHGKSRDLAIAKAIDLMNGKSAKTKVALWCRDSNGKLTLDEDGQKMPLIDIETGDQKYEEVYMTVTPLIQLQSAAKVIEVTNQPAKLTVDINNTTTISDDALEASNNAFEMFKAISENQRLGLLGGANINNVQQIGDMIETQIEEDNDE